MQTTLQDFKRANGRLQKAEKLGHYEITFPLRGVTF